MFRFWLDVGKQLESDLSDWLAALTSKRQMKPTIVNALRLFFDLSQGRTNVLCELFPFVLEAKVTTAPAPVAARPGPALKDLDSDLITQAAPTDKPKPKWNIPYCNLQLGLYQLGSIKQLDELETQVLEYGLSVGKLPAAKVKPILEKRQVKVTAAPAPIPDNSASNGKRIDGSEITFEAPTIDDLEI
jgi:hypothetical protein